MTYDPTNISNVLNFLFSLSAIPADLIMIYYITKIDSGKIKGHLTFLFVSIFVVSFTNTLYYIARLINLIPSRPYAGIRSLITNILLSILAWSFVLFVRKLNQEKP